MSIGPVPSIKGASPDVVQAIKTASTRTGVDFGYLVDQARAESAFRPDARARTSSATGLYQFIDSTWLATIQKHGAKHGLGMHADAVKTDFQGRPFIADQATRKAVLDLRKDPAIASLMAAELAADNQAHLEKAVGRDVNATDLYFAHFLGAGGAARFLARMESRPDSFGVDLMPRAAAANRPVFYHADGSKRTLAQIYAFFDGKFTGAQAAEGKAPEIINNLQNQAQTARPVPYRPDPQFSRFYAQPVVEFVSRAPSLPFMAGDDFFSLLTRTSDTARVQNQVMDSLSFLMLTHESGSI